MMSSPTRHDDSTPEKTQAASESPLAVDCDRLRRGLTAFARRRVPPADADDIVQSCLIRIHRYIGTLRSHAQLEAWSYQIVRHAVTDHYRVTARQPVITNDAADALPSSAPEELTTARQQLGQCVQPLIETLKPEDREALRQVDLADERQTDLAHAHGMSLSGMKSRVQRARRRLRSALEACCTIQRDVRGGITAFERKGASCACSDGCTCGRQMEPATSRHMARRI